MTPARSERDDIPSGAAPAVVRATAVLDALASSPRGLMSLSELSREVGVAKSSLLQICAALEAGGLVRRDEAGYALGRRTVELGGAYLARLDQVQEFYDACARSALMANETLRLSALAGIDTLCLARYEGHPPIRYTSGIGDRTPSSVSAQGKALLAKLDDSEVRRMYHGIGELPRVTRHSRRTVAALVKDLGIVRSRGYAVDEQESALQVVGLAVTVPTRGLRAPMLAVSVTLLDTEATPERRSAMIDELRRLSLQLGNPMQPEMSASGL
ncbi:MAG: IclR family transcriptional regulator [Propionibacteriaceae bacterium]|nr:IclR family transcriptional regulator [Propionibacteriaceae bacterium]